MVCWKKLEEIIIIIIIKITLKFTLHQATKAQRWSRGIALLFP